MKRILLYPTMRCNLKCPYCHFGVEHQERGYTWSGYEKDHYIESEISPDRFLKFIKDNAPMHIEFSGGEPTLYKGFKRLVNMLPCGCSWAITSNTLTDIQGVDFEKCISWTASGHVYNDIFKKNIAYIKSKTPNVSVSMVMTMKGFDKCVQRAQGLAELRIRVNLLRELNPGVNWEKTKEWETLVKMRAWGYNVVEDDIPGSFEFDSGYMCRGGSEYIAIMPDGLVYRCYSEAMNGQPIGKVKNFKFEPEPFKCDRPCLGCGEDHKARLFKLGE